jgi:hypothetical protein
MASRHLCRLALAAICLGICLAGQESTVNWDTVMKAAKTYFSSPSSENAFRLYSVLPKTQVSGEEKDLSEGSLYVKADHYIFDNLSVLEKQVKKPDRNAVKVAVRLWTIADGAFAECLCDMLYGVVRADPQMFLEEFSYFPGTYQEMVDVLGSVLHGGVRLYGGKPFQAEAVLEELETRVKALEKVQSDDLLINKLRREAISLIKSDMQRMEAERALIPTGPLGVFLQSPEISERRAAYQDILKNSERYIEQIKKGLEIIERAKLIRIDVLKRYIYLAAIIRSDKFIDPLVSIFKSYRALGGECVYCCPIVFALTLYGAFSNWSPPADMISGWGDRMVSDLRTEIQQIDDMKNKPLVWERLKVEFADPEKQKWFERIESLPVQELIKMTDPENADSNERYWAVQVLGGKVINDKDLTELYWLAIEALSDDPSPFYLCCTYQAIERAEIAKAQKNRRRQ